MANKPTILIAAGGTGGHIFPALAVAQGFEQEYTIIWLGTKQGMESRIVTSYPLHTVSAVGVRGKQLTKLLIAPVKLLYALGQTMHIIRKYKVSAVIGFGGFVGGIGGLGALLSRRPLIIHEQNSISGTSNRYLHKYATTTFTAFANVLPGAEVCGNPIMWEALPKQNITTPHSSLTLLILGGSLGAHALNNIIPTLEFNGHILHQCGRAHHKEVTKLYEEQSAYANYTYEVVPFIKDMPSYYARADIVICRAGAMTISELIKTQSCAILIPFPYAIDNHQYHNAKILTKHDCAVLIEQSMLSKTALEEVLHTLTIKRIKQMQNNYAVFPSDFGARRIASKVSTLLREQSNL